MHSSSQGQSCSFDLETRQKCPSQSRPTPFSISLLLSQTRSLYRTVLFCKQYQLSLSVKSGGFGTHGWAVNSLSSYPLVRQFFADFSSFQVAGDVILDLSLISSASISLPDHNASPSYTSLALDKLAGTGVIWRDAPSKTDEVEVLPGSERRRSSCSKSKSERNGGSSGESGSSRDMSGGSEAGPSRSGGSGSSAKRRIAEAFGTPGTSIGGDSLRDHQREKSDSSGSQSGSSGEGSMRSSGESRASRRRLAGHQEHGRGDDDDTPPTPVEGQDGRLSMSFHASGSLSTSPVAMATGSSSYADNSVVTSTWVNPNLPSSVSSAFRPAFAIPPPPPLSLNGESNTSPPLSSPHASIVRPMRPTSLSFHAHSSHPSRLTHLAYPTPPPLVHGQTNHYASLPAALGSYPVSSYSSSSSSNISTSIPSSEPPQDLLPHISPIQRLPASEPYAYATFGAGILCKQLDSYTGQSPLGPYYVPTAAFPVGTAIMMTGGFGFLSRRYGLSMDNLVEVEVVTADGEVKWVNADSDPGIIGFFGDF